MPQHNHTQSEHRSEEMEEVIGRIPPWIIRRGLSVFLLVAVAVFFVAGNIRFSDTMPVKVIIQAKEQPGKVTISRQEAHQEFRFLVAEGDEVIAGDTLLVLYNRLEGTTTPTITPMDGTIYVSKGINETNTLDQVIWVVPPSNEVEVKIRFGNKGAGNVKVDQPIRIALHDYPNADYGYLDGHVTSVLPIQMDEQQQANVRLDHPGVLTDRGIQLPVKPMMLGDGELLLNERSILRRIFGSIVP